MKGVLLAGGLGSRLGPASTVVNKHLLPVYDKPLIYYPLSTLMLAGVRELVVVTSARDLQMIQDLLGNGQHLGMEITYALQDRPLGVVDGLLKARDFLTDGPVTLALGDNIFHGAEFGLSLSDVYSEGTASIFGVRVPDPSRYAVVELDEFGQVASIAEKPELPKSQWIVPGLYVLPSDVWAIAAQVQPSTRGELEVANILSEYLDQGRLHIRLVSRASYWTDAGTPESLLDAANHVATLTSLHGELVASPEEIAYRKGWIGDSQLRQVIARLDGSGYAARLRRCLREQAEADD